MADEEKTPCEGRLGSDCSSEMQRSTTGCLRQKGKLDSFVYLQLFLQSKQIVRIFSGLRCQKRLLLSFRYTCKISTLRMCAI